MFENGYPVKVHCPIRNVEDTVYFHPIEIAGEWRVDINSFNGCDIGWHDCQECEECKHKAYKKMFDRA